MEMRIVPMGWGSVKNWGSRKNGMRGTRVLVNLRLMFPYLYPVL